MSIKSGIKLVNISVSPKRRGTSHLSHRRRYGVWYRLRGVADSKSYQPCVWVPPRVFILAYGYLIKELRKMFRIIKYEGIYRIHEHESKAASFTSTHLREQISTSEALHINIAGDTCPVTWHHMNILLHNHQTEITFKILTLTVDSKMTYQLFFSRCRASNCK